MLRAMVRWCSIAVVLVWELALAVPAQAQAGALDPTFGTGGKVTTDFFRHFDEAAALVVQADGKLVAAGGTARPAAGGRTTDDFALARYNPDGTLDRQFGAGGKVTTDFFGDSDGANALVLQADGKLVAAGPAFTGGGSNPDFALARYTPSGHLDKGFGTEGKVTTDFAGNHDIATALVVQPDGKLVAAGYTLSQSGSASDFVLARYNPDGSLDASFGTGGKVTTFFGFFAQAFGLVVQADGKLVAAGFTRGAGDFVLVRYNPDGSLDASFGTGGIVTTFFGSGEAHALALQADGKLVAAGRAVVGSSFDFALARYNPDGSLDPTFGTGGIVTTDFAANFDEALGLALQADGKLVAAGAATFGPTQDDIDFALARYSAQ
jgi:uncharacterized delta-60 repeat protein